MASIENLQNAVQREVLDIVSKLREAGLGDILELPQIVVCGDQSSGKSSVLEAISELAFPRKEGLCTRFATEVVLRDEPETSITASIVTDPAPSKTNARLKRMRNFHYTVQSFSDFPEVIDEATKCMGLDDATKSGPKAFTKDILKVEISGPGMPQL